MVDTSNNIAKTSIAYPQHELLVPMSFPGASPLISRGIARAGLTLYPASMAIIHDKPKHHSIVYTVSGSATVSWQDSLSPVEPNTLWIAPAGISHTFTAGNEAWYAMWFSIRRLTLWRHLESARPQFRFPGQAARMVHVMSGLISESSSPSEDCVQMGRHFAEILGIYLDRRLHRGGELSGDTMRQRLGILWEQVGANLQRPWSISDMAIEIALSPSHLYRVVQQFHQATPMRVLTLLRLQRAQDLLAHTPHKLEYIAHRVGYASPFALSRAFKRHIGISPEQYRRQESSIFAERDARILLEDSLAR